MTPLRRARLSLGSLVLRMPARVQLGTGTTLSGRQARRSRASGLRVGGVDVLEPRLMLTLVDYKMVTVGDPGNAADTTGYGSVAETYQIGKYDVTVSQYTEFLNAIAATDAYALYDPNMALDLNYAGITQSGNPGSFTYSVIGGSGDLPIVWVDWFDAARFANWMQNGQPTGDQGPTTTEQGAYDLNGATYGYAPPVAKNASFYVPTEDQWYKAAYYSPTLNSGAGGYYTYATQSDSPPGNVVGGTANQANYQLNGIFCTSQSSTYSMQQNYLTAVGSFTASASYYGTYDQSGNVNQWTDSGSDSGAVRTIRGGRWDNQGSESLSSSYSYNDAPNNDGNGGVGFRLAAPAATTSAPTDISLGTSTITENAPIGTTIGTLSTTDADPADTFRYALVKGPGSTDNRAFTIVGDVLTSNATFNYEARSAYSVRVRATDPRGMAVEKVLPIVVTDVSEPVAPPTVVLPVGFTVPEDTATGLVFTTPPFADVDSPATVVMTVVLSVADGAIAAVAADGVTVGGTATARSFRGTQSALNAFFTAAPARITYTPAPDVWGSRALTARITEGEGARLLASTTDSVIVVTAVNDAPAVVAPPRFRVVEDVRGNLTWPAGSKPFRDVDSQTLTVTLTVAGGVISAVRTPAVAVGGTATARTFTGTPASLNAYFRRAGSIAYTTAADDVTAQTLRTTVSDGSESATALSVISVKPIDDRPSIRATVTLGGGRVDTPYEITSDALRSQVQAADAETDSPALIIVGVDSGTLETWSGDAWIPVPTSANGALEKRLVAAGGRIRWIPPAGAVGDRPAFRIRAFDGRKASTVATRVAVQLATD